LAVIRVATVAGLLAMSVGCAASGPGPLRGTESGSPLLHRPLPAQVFLTVQDEPGGARRGLDLRDSTNGRVVRELLATRFDRLQASTVGDGDVIAAAESPRCHVGIYRINPASGARRLLRTVRDNVYGFAVSPDGRRAAYLTTGRCIAPNSRGAGGGLAGVGPQTLVVLDLQTGGRVSTSVDTPGYPLAGVTFDPTGTEIATTYRRDGSIRLLNADHPDLAHAATIGLPGRCGYLEVVWSSSGLDAIQGCGVSPLLDPGPLVQLTHNGKRVRSWALPKCVDGIGLATDASRRHVYMQVGIGHGMGEPCGAHWSQRIVAVGATRLRVVMETPGMQQTYELAG